LIAESFLSEAFSRQLSAISKNTTPSCWMLIADGVLLIEAVSHQLSAISEKTCLAAES
jgi:hypothetical protein